MISLGAGNDRVVGRAQPSGIRRDDGSGILMGSGSGMVNGE
ncbi:hypothetical protein CyaNS01_00566 [Cyanobium sp. NS01]|nr:hypothetical protein CyaNS01_00566 [Cyanobium sp. NS01]